LIDCKATWQSNKYADKSKCNDIVSSRNRRTKIEMSKVVKQLELLVGL
jgi:hypothetical protein